MTTADTPLTELRRAEIEGGATALGIEFGSTRIKAVLIGPDFTPLAQGGHQWENSLVDGVWSYGEDEIWEGLSSAYADLAADVRAQYGVDLHTVGSIGISAMMHGYLALDAHGKLLVPFRTWRNTSTGPASEALTDLFAFNIPQRWSIAHLYQAILDEEAHIPQIARITTLAGLVHERLTGRHVLGVGDASGMFPIDPDTGTYDATRMANFDALVAQRAPWALGDLLPAVVSAGENAGELTAQGAALLDPAGLLRPGLPMAPPEGDAGTGMVATNAVAPRTGNVSAGTSIFAMVVLEKDLKSLHLEIDPVTTPDGSPVAMVHSNNGASELDTWVAMFVEFATLAGMEVSTGQVYDLLYRHALQGAPDGGGVLAYNLLSGEPITDLDEGRPLVLRAPGTSLNLADFMRAELMTVFATLRIGMDILLGEEEVGLDRLFAHGGIFKTAGVAQKVLADALNTAVAVGTTAGEGGAWGMAVLARFRAVRAGHQSLSDFLASEVVATDEATVIEPTPSDVEGFDRFMGRYREGLPIVAAAIEHS